MGCLVNGDGAHGPLAFSALSWMPGMSSTGTRSRRRAFRHHAPRRVLVLVAAALLVPAGVDAQVEAPVLKWQRGGCFASWCQTGWYSSPAVADLDGDGRNEVVWGSYDVVALNGTDGSLRWRGPNGSRVWPGIAIADLTADGTLEVVVGRGSDQLTVHDRFGTVLWNRTPFGSGEIRTLAVDDLDADGALEIIVGRASGGSTRQLSVYEADGSVRAGWPARRDGEPGYGWGMYNENVAVADMDGDGLREVFGPTDTHYITALDRDGDQLPASSIYDASDPVGPKVWSQVGVHVDHAVDLRGWANCGTEHRPNFANSAPAVGDVDGNGIPELVVVGNVYDCGTSPYTSLYEMPFLLNADRSRWSGAGFDWTAIPPPGPGSEPLSEDYNVIESAAPNAVMVDLDGDGLEEILYASYDGKVHAWWLDKTEHGRWPHDVPGSGLRFASEPVVADLDADGQAEVIFASWPQKGTAQVGQVHILSAFGVPLHAVDLPPSFPPGDENGGLGAPTLGDLDGDPDLELVVGTVSSGVVAYDLPGTAAARVLWTTGRGGLRRTGVAPDSRPAVPTAHGDFDGDGREDILWRHVGGASYVWLMNGTAVSGASLPLVGPTWRVAAIGDLDGDGRDDLVWRHTSGAIYLWLMEGATVKGQGFTSAQTGRTWHLRAVGDFDGDGRADILWRHLNGSLYLWLMSGTSRLAGGSLPGVTNAWDIRGVGDFDGDGRADLLWRELASGATYMWRMNGAAVVGQGLTAAQADPSWKIVGVGDLDGDGHADLLWRHSSGLVHVWLMAGTSIVSSVTVGAVEPSWSVQGMGDFDGGGTKDVLWRERGGATCLWLMSGTTVSAAGFTSAQAGNAWEIRSPR
jgi:hypothetical protein